MEYPFVMGWVGVFLAIFLVGFLWRRQTQRSLKRLTQAIERLDHLAVQFQKRVAQLESNQSQMTGILQSMEEGVLVVGMNFELLLINPSARQTLEISPSLKPGDFLTGFIRYPQLDKLIRDTLKTQQPATEELTLYTPIERILQVHATACRSGETQSAALLVFHDVTQMKRLEQMRREFVANVSHELKTPLTAIRGSVETLLDGALKDTTHARNFLTSIQEETNRLTNLVDDLLALAQLESKETAPHQEPLDLKSFLEKEVERFQKLASKHGVILEAQIQISPTPFRAQARQLSQAVDNLLDNAIKYNRPGGKVTLRASQIDQRIRVEVEDTGPGIPEADLPRVFERFYRVDKARSRETGGTGLGLSIVKHVVEAHGGTVSVHSQLGRGSCFTIELPLQ